jgi:phosphomannomutase
VAIHFGTDGWRAVISDEFTFENVRCVAQAIAEQIKADAPPEAVPMAVVGFDTRFLSDRYAITVSNVLAANGAGGVPQQGRLPDPGPVLCRARPRRPRRRDDHGQP